MLPDIALTQCPDLAVSMNVMHHVVHVESSYNPYAIGVVGGRLVRQPKNLPEALATVRMLEGRGFNFSLGLAQVNRYNLVKYGIDSYEKAFEVCPNLQAGSKILAECYRRSNNDWGKSFSCYYSGDFATGFRHGYVQKIYASIRSGWNGQNVAVDPMAIPLVERRVAAAVAPTATLAGVATRAAPTSRLGAAQAEYAQARTAPAPVPALVAEAVVTPAVTPAAAVPLPTAGSELIASASATTDSVPPAIAGGPVMLTPDGPVMPGQAMPPNAPAAGPPGPAVDSAFVF